MAVIRAGVGKKAIATAASSHHRLRAKGSLNILDDDRPSATDGVPLIPRHGEHENFSAKWQARGSHYISYENLRVLNEKLAEARSDRSSIDKKALLSEVCLTYFARFHNIIREEYQHEKRSVEERLVTWPLKRLRSEGFVLFDLRAAPKGNLFQEKVFRFSLRGQRQGPPSALPFHRFGVGDTVRVSSTKSHPSDLVSESSEGGVIDGVVLDRRRGYLDICLKADDAILIDKGAAYRLDAIVNRVTYDRMIQSLQLFLQPGDETMPLSRTLRDLIIYSYPNSITRLANTPGGLRLALPQMVEEGGGCIDCGAEEIVGVVMTLTRTRTRTEEVVGVVMARSQRGMRMMRTGRMGGWRRMGWGERTGKGGKLAWEEGKGRGVGGRIWTRWRG